MIDFALWDSLLRTYVNQQGQVDYANWKRLSTQDLQQWLDEVATSETVYQYLRVGNCDRAAANTQIAFYLNLYNALTIVQVLQRYPISSIQPKFLGLPNWLAFLQFFSRPVYRIDGQALSLNAIEHDILRQQFTEPRIHFALVCASVGCPLLRNSAYTPEQVQTQLEEDALRFINNPAKVRYDRQSNILYCSKIFKWYKKDFLKVSSSIPAYIQAYLKDKSDLDDDTPISYLPYNWNLNQRTSS